MFALVTVGTAPLCPSRAAQVYRTQKAKLNKDTRMQYAKLDDIVRQIVTVKNMGVDFDAFAAPGS